MPDSIYSAPSKLEQLHTNRRTMVYHLLAYSKDYVALCAGPFTGAIVDEERERIKSEGQKDINSIVALDLEIAKELARLKSEKK